MDRSPNNSEEPKLVRSRTLQEDIDRLVRDGYRLEMVTPADAPRRALLSRGSKKILLDGEEKPQGGNSEWSNGRAGMAYRDLIDGRLDGRVIASHIRIDKGGPVRDHVHYHKIDFQMIYCLKGRIRVVYEDQGPPFFLEPGDCVVQPPRIRHRVLEAEPGSEVLEVSSPAEHETWIEHELELPNKALDTERDFDGQRFVRHISGNADWIDFYEKRVRYRDTGVADATNGFASANVLRVPAEAQRPVELTSQRSGFEFLYVTSGQLNLTDGTKHIATATADQGCVVPDRPGITRAFHPGTEAICIQIPRFHSIDDPAVPAS